MGIQFLNNDSFWLFIGSEKSPSPSLTKDLNEIEIDIVLLS